MSGVEELLTGVLRERAGAAPDDVGLLDAVYRRAQRRQHRRWGATAVAAAAAGLVVAAGVLWPAAPASAPAAGSASVTVADSRSITYREVVLAVPDGWTVADSCGSTVAGAVAVETDQAPGAGCDSPAATVVWVLPADTPTGRRWAAHAGARPQIQGHLALLALPAERVVVVVRAPEPAEARRVLAGIRVGPLRLNPGGCPATPPRTAAAPPDPAWLGRWAQGPHQAVICRYSPAHDPAVVSARVADPQLPRLTQLITAPPSAGTGRRAAAGACPATGVTYQLRLVSWLDGRPGDSVADLDYRCPAVPASSPAFPVADRAMLALFTGSLGLTTTPDGR